MKFQIPLLSASKNSFGYLLMQFQTLLERCVKDSNPFGLTTIQADELNATAKKWTDDLTNTVDGIAETLSAAQEEKEKIMGDSLLSSDGRVVKAMDMLDATWKKIEPKKKTKNFDEQLSLLAARRQVKRASVDVALIVEMRSLIRASAKDPKALYLQECRRNDADLVLIKAIETWPRNFSPVPPEVLEQGLALQREAQFPSVSAEMAFVEKLKAEWDTVFVRVLQVVHELGWHENEQERAALRKSIVASMKEGERIEAERKQRRREARQAA